MQESKFTGGLLGLIGIRLLSVFLAIITLGLGIPWAVCYTQRWYTKHTYIDGKQLVFKGTAMGLFGQYIKWFLLTIITIGIYGFWLNIKLHQWVISNTTFTN
jgi:uncharacterized membrane protein YjgN (DUF898 family)